MTGILIRDAGDGIWDDGEWISWEFIDSQLPKPQFSAEAQPRGTEILKLIEKAIDHEKQNAETSRLWGKIGELYAAERFGVDLARENAQGHDGRLGDDFVEIKTITARKRRLCVRVKRAGNFNMLAIVRVNQEYQLAAVLVDRRQLMNGSKGKFATVSWRRAWALATG